MAAFGGGTNSAAMLVELARRGEFPDAVLFADTGGEKPHTYRFIEAIQRWLAARSLPQIVIVKQTFTDYATLEDNCLRNGTIPSVAYGFKSCSEKWKIRPQNTWLKQWEPAVEAWARGEKVVKMIGYDADEERRAKARIDEHYEFRYPLIEWGWGRDECIAAIVKAGLPLPGKSACFFCPNSKRSEVRSLRKTYPELFDRAIAMEKNAAANLTTIRGLGREWRWQDVAATDDAQGSLFDTVADMPCGCYDGDE